MNKIILLDWGIFSHRAIFASVNNPQVPATFTCLSMILGNLKRIGIDKEDKVIVACDGRNSWRKDFEKEYKGDRKAKRKESPIDWDYQYKKFDELLESLEIATNWSIIKEYRIEADDIMAVACRYYKNTEIVLATYDSDLEQCWHYEGVKLFSPMSKKWKLKPKNFNVYKILAKKIQKEVADNLVNPILNEEDYFNRMTCVNLIELPEWVEHLIIKRLDNLKERTAYPDRMPFKSIKDRYYTLYTDKSKVIDYQKQFEKEEKKKLKKLLKKQELKNEKIKTKK